MKPGCEVIEVNFEELKALKERARQGPLGEEDYRQLEATIEALSRLIAMIGDKDTTISSLRALLSKPKFLMLDEPSLGIAPLLVKTIFERIVEINREQGLTILLVEQNANLALDVSSYGYVLETGKILLEGPSAELKANPQVQEAYLGA